MTKKKVIETLLVAGMTIVSTAVLSAQRIDKKALAGIVSGAVTSPAKMSSSGAAVSKTDILGGTTKNSLVGAWTETATFSPTDPIRPNAKLKSLVTFHGDGTMSANDEGSVSIDPNPPKSPSDVIEGLVFNSGVGVWAQTRRPHTFVYTQHELITDLNGNSVGDLIVRGIYRLLPSGDQYTGNSVYKLSLGDATISGSVTNSGSRIPLGFP
jgi:hypothetical protein